MSVCSYTRAAGARRAWSERRRAVSKYQIKKHPTGCSRRLGILGTLGQSVSYTTATFGELALNAGGGYELADINSRRPPPHPIRATIAPAPASPRSTPRSPARPHHAATPQAASRPHRHRHAPAAPLHSAHRRPAPHASPTSIPPPRSSHATHLSRPTLTSAS